MRIRLFDYRLFLLSVSIFALVLATALTLGASPAGAQEGLICGENAVAVDSNGDGIVDVCVGDPTCAAYFYLDYDGDGIAEGGVSGCFAFCSNDVSPVDLGNGTWDCTLRCPENQQAVDTDLDFIPDTCKAADVFCIAIDGVYAIDTDFDGVTDTCVLCVSPPIDTNADGVPDDCERLVEPEVTCAANAGTISWNDAGQSKYWIYRSTPDRPTFEWIGRTLGGTTFSDPYPTVGAEYQVRFAGAPFFNCTIEAEPAASRQPFSCSVTNGEIEWTDHGQNKYWVYRSTPNNPTFTWIGRTLGDTAFTDRNPVAGSLYQVHYAGISRTDCD